MTKLEKDKIQIQIGNIAGLCYRVNETREFGFDFEICGAHKCIDFAPVFGHTKRIDLKNRSFNKLSADLLGLTTKLEGFLE